MELSRNERIMLNAIYHSEKATRSAISAATGINLVDVSSTLKALEQRGLITRSTQGASRGRPTAVFRLDPRFGCTIGISVDLDAFRITVMDATRNVVSHAMHLIDLSPDPALHDENILSQAAQAARNLIDSTRSAGNRILSVGITLPGMIDTARGIWLQGLQVSGITHVNVRDRLEKALGLPVFVEDEARALTSYEMSSGLGKGVDDFVVLYLGTGIGTGVVINGRLYRGTRGMAGEIGHLTSDTEGYRCVCGSVGCLETVVSTQGILRRFRDRLAEGVWSMLQRPEPGARESLTLEKIREAAEAGDRLSESILFEIGLLLGEACAKLIKLFNPQKIVISGPVVVFARFLEAPITQAIKLNVISEILGDTLVEFATYTPDQESRGAALLALDFYWDDMGGEESSPPARSTRTAHSG